VNQDEQCMVSKRTDCVGNDQGEPPWLIAEQESNESLQCDDPQNQGEGVRIPANERSDFGVLLENAPRALTVRFGLFGKAELSIHGRSFPRLSDETALFKELSVM
jgi:hypothetical protein